MADMRARLENGMAEAIDQMSRRLVPRLARFIMTKRGFWRWRAAFKKAQAAQRTTNNSPN